LLSRSAGCREALKAALIASDIDPPRTHNLNSLRNLLPEQWNLAAAPMDLSELTAWAEESRYPGEWDEPSEDDAKAAVEEARTAVNTVLVDFGKDST